MSNRKNIREKAPSGKSRSASGAFRAAGAAVVSALAVVGAVPPQAAQAAPVPAGVSANPAHGLLRPVPQEEIANALAQLGTAVRAAEPKRAATERAPSTQGPAGRKPVPQAKPAGAKSALAAPVPAGPEGSAGLDGDVADDDGDGADDDDLPRSLSRGAGYDQVTAAAVQDPATARALRVMARSERKQAASANAAADTDADDPDGADGPAGADGGQNSDPALTSVLSLNNGPILYQPPCPFGWPPPDRYGGLADIIELAPMAGSFVSEAFAPAAAWQPMAQLFGPLLAIIQPTIKQNKYWIDPTIINVQNPINAVHFLFFGWYDVWHRKKFLQEEVEWASEVAPWLQQVYQTPQAACWVAFLGMFERLVETGNPWPRGWHVEDHATTWDIDKIGPYEPASPGSRPKALQDLDHQLAKEDGDGGENAPPSSSEPKKPQPPAQSQPEEQRPAPTQTPAPPSPPPQPPSDPSAEAAARPRDSFPAINAGVEVR